MTIARLTNALISFFVCLVGSTLLAQPVITSQPSDQVVTNGGTAVFSVAVAGTGPFTYQWQFNGANYNLITIVAGMATNGYSGDGGAAINASLNSASGVAADNAGNFFIVDQNNQCIRKVDTNGIIATVATIPTPYGLAVDNVGNLFVTSTASSLIVKVDTNGIVTTVAGNGGSGYSGDGGPATNAMLWSPSGVALDSTGNLFIADSSNNRIREVDTNGIITTVAGIGAGGFLGDGGLAINALLKNPGDAVLNGVGELFIADSGNNRIRKVSANGGISTVAGSGSSASVYSGPATSIALSSHLQAVWQWIMPATF